jgi:hypothetical protein
MNLLTGGPGWTARVGEHASSWRSLVLGGTALLVLFGRARGALVGAIAMLLAHFVSYVHVWEHHASGIIVLGVLLLVILQRRMRQDVGRASARGKPPVASLVDGVAFGVAAVATVILALPSPFALFDTVKDPHVWDPSVGWSLGVRVALAGSKAVPSAVLFLVALREALRDGLGLPWVSPVT